MGWQKSIVKDSGRRAELTQGRVNRCQEFLNPGQKLRTQVIGKYIQDYRILKQAWKAENVRIRAELTLAAPTDIKIHTRT